MTDRHKFNEDELEQYFDRVALPKSKRVIDASVLSDTEKLAYLNLIQKHQLVKVPWENLTQHYSWHRVVNVQPRHLFRKIVYQPGRGGYCMEANGFFHTVLLSLGFDVYMAGSRICKRPNNVYGGWTHVVNIVTIAGTRYLLDGGYGGPGPSHPLPLEHGAVSTQISPAESRLVFEPIPQNLNQTHKVWIYQHRFDKDSPWTTHYCFVDFEFIPEDIESMNFAPWLNPRTFFTHKVVANRFTTDRETDEVSPGSASEEAMEGEIDGAITLNHDELKWRRHGKKVVHIPFQTEEDRLAAIQKYFGITLSPEDAEAIEGTAAAIGAAALGDD